MLILADGEDVKDLVPSDERIRLIHLAESRSIGEKRNFGCERSSGEIICHWDDDDWVRTRTTGAPNRNSLRGR
jgi:glycosyltransferase involved in cell wall biosynthesis